MIKQPLIEIVIPTFNRLLELKKNIPDILAQAANTNSIISFYDNASSDGTEEYLREFAENEPRIRYHRNVSNIGLDRNMLLGVEHAVGEYVFWLGDDDVLRPDALKVIQSILLKYSPDMLLLQMIYNNDSWNYSPPKQSFYDRPDHFFNECCYLMPFGTQVFKNTIAKNQLPKAERFIGTYHAYSGALLDGIAEGYKKNGMVSIIHHLEPLVKCSGTKKTWSSDKVKMYLVGLPKWFDVLDSTYTHAQIKKDEYSDWPDYLDALGAATIDDCDAKILVSSIQSKLCKFRKIIESSSVLNNISDKTLDRIIENEKKLAEAQSIISQFASMSYWVRMRSSLLPCSAPAWWKGLLNKYRQKQL